MRFLTISSKGGVGKSTIARHILPTIYGASKDKPFGYIDTDTSNFGVELLSKSRAVKVLTKDRDITQPEIFVQTDKWVIDVAGKDEDVLRVIRELKKLALLNFIQVAIIPILPKSEEDVYGAIYTIEMLKKEGFTGGIIIALNRMNQNPIEEYEKYIRNKEVFKRKGATGEVVIPDISPLLEIATKQKVSVADLSIWQFNVREKIEEIWNKAFEETDGEKKKKLISEIKQLQELLPLEEVKENFEAYSPTVKKILDAGGGWLEELSL